MEITNMANTNLHKIQLQDITFYLYSNLKSHIDDVSIILTNGEIFYKGFASKEDLKKFSDDLDMSDDRYYDLLKKAFTGIIQHQQQQQQQQFKYQLMQNNCESTYEFIWKQILTEGMQYQLGRIILQKEEKPSISILEIFEYIHSELVVMKTEVSELTKKKLLLEAEKLETCKKMETYIDEKNSLEQDLYIKFVKVLNEKKAKIRELKAQVGMEHQVVPKNPRRDLVECNEDSDEDIDTDEENEKSKEPETIASSSTSSSSSTPATPNIILDNRIQIDDDKPRKNRKRIRASKPKTPVVPRTKSLPRPQQVIGNEKEISYPKPKVIKDDNADDLLDDL